MRSRLAARFAEEDGVSGVAVFLGIAVWAVLALVCLTATLVLAGSIDQKVKGITHSVGDIDLETKGVALLTETNAIADAILVAAKPLSGQLDQVSTSAKAIDQSAASIKGHVDKIDATAGSILTNATSINGIAKEINTKALAIDGKAKDINATASAILVNAQQINASARLIFVPIPSLARSINARLSVANDQAEAILNAAKAIAADVKNVLAQVGTETKGNHIQGHANSIDCSALINGTGCKR